ncbi:olfactory receptor 10J4-like [Osmerus mordax]|uniref:olfactory receptor 10J4-like n=1 Tax=Osmerus mordax TaxID=8014 RepID=UPI00350FED84
MENDTSPFYFTLTLFKDLGLYRYLYFMICFLLYALMLSLNIMIIVIVLLERTLHEPMYVFISCLSINSLYGSTGLFPRLMVDLFSDTHLISRPACFTQIYVVYTYASYELIILGIMAYDRYVAICKPLHYNSIMNSKTVVLLVGFGLVYPICSIGSLLYLSVRLPLCGNEIARVFCVNWPVVQLSCVDTTQNNAAGLLVTITTVFLPLGFVLYTYFRIIVVCQKSSTEYRGKALKTCLPHIVTFVIYSIALFCEVSLSRYKHDELNPVVTVILSLEFLIIPPILNPLVYGLNLPQIRGMILRLLQTPRIVACMLR